MPEAPRTISQDLPFIELQSVDSTNNYAREQIKAGQLPGRQGEVVHGMAFFAHEQMAGKGQRGKNWASQKGDNIALSILIKPAGLTLENQFQLGACVAVSVARFFEKYAGDDTKIKWPNDLYWQDRKAGGILIESVVGSGEWGVGSRESGDLSSLDILSSEVSAEGGGTENKPSFAKATEGKWKWAIIGIGININQIVFPADLPNPVSLKQITGKTFSPSALAKELHQHVVTGINTLQQNGGREYITEYNNLLYKRSEYVRLRKENRVMEVLVKEVTAAGKLIVQHGLEEEIDFGTVEWIVEK